jgi:uncharacterized damage-inducible protein DinB
MREHLQGIVLDELDELAEKQLQEVIERFQNLPSGILLQPPAQGGWSIVECFEHLTSYASFYLPRLNESLARAPLVSGDIAFSYSLLGRYFIRLMDPQRSAKKMKAMKKHLPTKSLEPHKVIALFIQNMEELVLLLKQCRERDLRRMRITTSISPLIRLNGGDALRFLLVHNERHLAQARSLLKVIG